MQDFFRIFWTVRTLIAFRILYTTHPRTRKNAHHWRYSCVSRHCAAIFREKRMFYDRNGHKMERWYSHEYWNFDYRNRGRHCRHSFHTFFDDQFSCRHPLENLPQNTLFHSHNQIKLPSSKITSGGSSAAVNPDARKPHIIRRFRAFSQSSASASKKSV